MTEALGRRSWFVTLTFRPAARLQLQYRAIERFNDRGRDPSHPSWEGLGEADRVATVERQAASEVCRYLKRLRKEAGSFRYCWVAEAHASGDVHYHLVLHEGETPLRERTLRLQWKCGFARANVVRSNDGVASYAMKIARYVSKSLKARVRASRRYGEIGLRDKILEETEVPGISSRSSQPSDSVKGAPSKKEERSFFEA